MVRATVFVIRCHFICESRVFDARFVGSRDNDEGIGNDGRDPSELRE